MNLILLLDVMLVLKYLAITQNRELLKSTKFSWVMKWLLMFMTYSTKEKKL